MQAGNKSPVNQKYSKDSLLRDTIIKNDIGLIEIHKGDQPVSLITLSGDTIIKMANYYHRIIYQDINKDGYNDIRVFIISNTPNSCDNYFFLKESNQFRQIENSYLDIEKVKGSNLFYSYNSVGCADMNWESHLSTIDDGKEVNIGHIIGNGCGDKDDGAYIYMIINGTEILFEKLPINNLLKQHGDKWSFIRNYWANNYRKFKK